MSSAAEIRSKKKAKTIDVTLPGGDLVITCRRPELLTLASSGWLTWPALQRVQELLKERSAPLGVEIDNRPVASVLEKAGDIAALLDEWVCAAAISPRIVLTEAESGPEVLWIDDLDLDDKMAILAATMPQTPVAVTEFRGPEPAGAADRPGSETLRDAPIDLVEC
jgi:hypothetical protein